MVYFPLKTVVEQPAIFILFFYFIAVIGNFFFCFFIDFIQSSLDKRSFRFRESVYDRHFNFLYLNYFY